METECLFYEKYPQKFNEYQKDEIVVTTFVVITINNNKRRYTTLPKIKSELKRHTLIDILKTFLFNRYKPVSFFITFAGPTN